MQMRIGLAFDLQTDPEDEQQAEFDPPATIAALRGALETLGHEVSLLGGAPELLKSPQRLHDVELVFNIAEGVHGRCREAWVPALLELYGVAYVGSDPLALALGLDKALSKRLASAQGILTPPWMCIRDSSELPAELPLAFPVIVKPRWEGSGRGIDAGAVVRTPAALRRRIEWLRDRCAGPMLVEEFIAAGELTVCVIGQPAVAYPAVQRQLDAATGLSCHVVKPVAPESKSPLVLDERLDAQARHMALEMFKLIGCRDVARVDLRVDASGTPHFLEINPLPSFDPEGTLGLLAEYLGSSYADLVGCVLEGARSRINGTRHSPQRIAHPGRGTEPGSPRAGA